MPHAKNKRTPTGKIDDAKKASGDDWEVQSILAFSTGKDGPRYLVRWKVFNEKRDTYEPEKNLSGSKELLAAFKKQRERDIEAAKGEAKAKHEAAVERKKQRPRGEPVQCCLYLTCISRIVFQWSILPLLPTRRCRKGKSEGRMRAHGGTSGCERATTRRTLVRIQC